MGAYPTPVVARWTSVQQPTTGDRVAIFDRAR
jgi:hypothetical protein